VKLNEMIRKLGLVGEIFFSLFKKKKNKVPLPLRRSQTNNKHDSKEISAAISVRRKYKDTHLWSFTLN
jgi:hypothetical protein